MTTASESRILPPRSPPASREDDPASKRQKTIDSTPPPSSSPSPASSSPSTASPFLIPSPNPSSSLCFTFVAGIEGAGHHASPPSSPPSHPSPPPSILSSFIPSLPPSLHLRELPHIGRALFTSRSLPPSTPLLRDQPIALLHFQRSARHSLCCSLCARYVGSLSTQLHRLSQHPDDAVLTSLPGIDADDHALTPLIPCPNGCPAAYCSTQCQTTAWDRHHQLLCPGPPLSPSSSSTRLSPALKRARKAQRTAARLAGLPPPSPPVPPIVAFTHHAMRHHQCFLMAAQLVATLTLHERRGGDVAQLLSKLAEYAQRPWLDTINLDEAWSPASSPPGSPVEPRPPSPSYYSDDGYSPDDEEHWQSQLEDEREGRRHDLRSHLQHVLVKSYHLLVQALFTRGGGGAGGGSGEEKEEGGVEGGVRVGGERCHVPAWMNVGWYGELLGLLRLNNVEVEVRNPLADYFDRVDSLPDAVRPAAFAALTPIVQRLLAAREAEAEWDRMVDADDDDRDGTASSPLDLDGSDDSNDSGDERSDSEDDESFRKEDEDSWPLRSYCWPAPSDLPPPTPTPAPADGAVAAAAALCPSPAAPSPPPAFHVCAVSVVPRLCAVPCAVVSEPLVRADGGGGVHGRREAGASAEGEGVGGGGGGADRVLRR